ncbi:hypothetical protein [Methylobacterium brachythecii]|uniref:Uncharacterized protein n=1 Tax=Methylobacterium brachythecii TaxID=1176177 RepID=A0A7W6APV0_9HYPH|nr:hypothetical protein [Methylobacterium brachythecii]MBB3903632.1 hypothetical protein [Methylobacterium brachythecii]GLS44202.1 hypothetical protein GCM10007884_21900 [Methylobacterium brachythecii]
MITISIIVTTPTGPILLGAMSERDAAITVEAIFYRLKPSVFPIPVEIRCRDERMKNRLIDYVIDLQGDLSVDRSASDRQQTSQS